MLPLRLHVLLLDRDNVAELQSVRRLGEPRGRVDLYEGVAGHKAVERGHLPVDGPDGILGRLEPEVLAQVALAVRLDLVLHEVDPLELERLELLGQHAVVARNAFIEVDPATWLTKPTDTLQLGHVVTVEKQDVQSKREHRFTFLVTTHGETARDHESGIECLPHNSPLAAAILGLTFDAPTRVMLPAGEAIVTIRSIQIGRAHV